MPVFAYKAMDASGQARSGNTPAPSRAAALDLLVQQGLIPVHVEEQQAAETAPPAPVVRGGRVSAHASETFIRELSNLLAGGVALSRALQILAREASQAAARQQWAAIHDEVVGGASLAEAMARWPRTFTPVQVAMVRAGETGGFLDVVLDQIAEFRSRERDLKAKVKGALIYPAVLAVLSTAVVAFLLVYFIPKFAVMFKDFDAALPSLTRTIIAVSQGVSTYALPVLAAVVLLVVLARRAARSESGRRFLQRLWLRLPLVGVVLARFALVRFCRMLGTLLGAGVPLVASLRVARESLGNQVLSDAVGEGIEEVQRGSSLARSLVSCQRLFPPSVSEIIAVAEESGRLDKELIRLASNNESELDRRLRMLVTLAEPLLLFFMAAVVGTIVIGMLLPVFTLQDYIH